MKAVWMSTVCAAMEDYGWVVWAVAEGRVDVWQYTVCTQPETTLISVAVLMPRTMWVSAVGANTRNSVEIHDRAPADGRGQGNCSAVVSTTAD